MNLTHLECSKTGKNYDASRVHNLSEAGAPLLARYDLEKAAQSMTVEDLRSRRTDMWRYAEVLPHKNYETLISLGEGWTPLRKAPRLQKTFGMDSILIKDESVNPTGSFKARGLSAAVNAAMERGIRSFAIPTAGNAGGALAAYAALAGAEAVVYMPADTPAAFRQECVSAGATVVLVDGLISDCGKMIAGIRNEKGWFDVSTLKEPYRLEGKKTMGYELYEQMDGKLPDVILYPTGGGTGLIGMWKAFDEMEKMGWITKDMKPRMVSVQAEGCAPVVKAWKENEPKATFWENAHTCASGLRVPAAVGDFLMLEAIRESSGSAIAVSDTEMMEFSNEFARLTGIFPAPEGGAVLAAMVKLRDSGYIKKHETVALFNTGSGYKYLEAYLQK
ncbi:MAG: threonine synthase [Balneolales bacterium]|nr:threonine synthase [Balneolales bacterium]